MEDGVEGQAPPGISALPLTTVRQLGSHQLLTDPSAVVKELIDNALDARAKSIFVDVTANTIDSIQVKDDGHGIPSEDRALACRRYCTSKIRDFHDLKQLGGKWLGFRGEALASLADMSGTVSITTRVEGEPVAFRLTYHRNGELASTERESHPVGTTVKVSKLLESVKVRKELAIKGAAKCLAKIRRLMQAYALARPATRFRLHVLKAKNNKSDFVYAPKANANVEDAAFKIVGKDCALQYEWAAIELGGFGLHAFLPKPAAVGPKIANQGAFISVDSRPVSAIRGTLKKIAAAFRARLRTSNPTLASIKDPFFCMNIICPMDSYDPNIEPAKDDVIFGDESHVMSLVNQLLISYYPEAVSSTESGDQNQRAESTSSEPIQNLSVEVLPPQACTFLTARENDTVTTSMDRIPATLSQQPHWRSNIYGIDDEDLGSLQPDAPFEIEEEEGSRDIAISNPWTIARMNAPVKRNEIINNGQLLSPAKSQSDESPAPRSPTPTNKSAQSNPVGLLTPEVIIPTNNHQVRLDAELQQSIQRLRPVDTPLVNDQSQPQNLRNSHAFEPAPLEERMSVDLAHPPNRSSNQNCSFAGTWDSTRSRRPNNNKPFRPPAPQSEDTWFGQPMRNTPQTDRPQKRRRQNRSTPLPNDNTHSSQRSLVLPVAERLVNTRLTSENNTDIRSFFGKPGLGHNSNPSLIGDDYMRPAIMSSQLRARTEQESSARGFPRRPQSADSHQQSIATAREMNDVFQLYDKTPPDQSSPAITPQLRRLRTADSSLQRTKSATLPLNFIPPGFATQALTLTINMSTTSITQHARKLDMTTNSLEWGYDSTDAYDVFSGPVSEHRIMGWVVRVDDLLRIFFERVEGVEVRGALHEGMQRFLDGRRAKGEEDAKRAVVAAGRQVPIFVDCFVSPQEIGNDERTVSGPSSEERVAECREQMADTELKDEVDEDMEDFDIEQFVDLDGGVRERSPVRVVKTEDEFGDDIEDEMLMGI